MAITTGNYVSYTDIVNQLDIQKGDVIYVASNIIKLAMVTQKNEKKFDADLFIDTLKNKIGEEGTLLFPGFNFKLKNGDVFDIKNTEPVTGTLAVKAFKRTDFKRTKHPLHSFLVWGKGQQDLVNLENKTSFGIDSPYHFMYEKNAKMLAIDLDLQGALTFAHYVEEVEKVAYRYWKDYTIKYIDENGKSENKKYKLFAKRAGYINNVNPLSDDFIKRKAIDTKKMNGIDFSIIPMNKAFQIIQKDIKENKAAKIHQFKWKVFLKDMYHKILGK